MDILKAEIERKRKLLLDKNLVVCYFDEKFSYRAYHQHKKYPISIVHFNVFVPIYIERQQKVLQAKRLARTK